MLKCHIRGLGACMLDGYPHRQEDSFFQLTLEQLAGASTCQITTSSYTLGGFPITRIPKHLTPHCLAANPTIVVIQFATSDLVVPLRKKRKRQSGSVDSSPRRVSSQSPSLKNRLLWQFQGLVGDALRRKPVTSPAVYLETMQQIAQTLLDHQVIPVVMSPFVFGGRRSDRFARECGLRLQVSLAKLPKAVYVDAYSALARHPRHRMLVADGTHLSLSGHRVVASTLLPHLKSLVDGRVTVESGAAEQASSQMAGPWVSSMG
jgi:lysophospholipase L1-like esterase